MIGRGAAAGAVAGLLTGGFAVLLAEPVMDRAVRLEEARTEAAHATGAAHEHAEVFSRETQHLGLVVSSVATGVALGVLFALVYLAVHRRDPDARPWERSMLLAGAAATGLWLLPFLRYPANPPGVGDPETLGSRTAGWLGALAIGTAAVILAWRVHAYLAGALPYWRQGAVAAVLAVGLAVLFLLPPNRDAVEVPATLLWDFRVLSAASSLLLWAALGSTFGLLGMRAARQAAVPSPAPAGA